MKSLFRQIQRFVTKMLGMPIKVEQPSSQSGASSGSAKLCCYWCDTVLNGKYCQECGRHKDDVPEEDYYRSWDQSKRKAIPWVKRMYPQTFGQYLGDSDNSHVIVFPVVISEDPGVIFVVVGAPSREDALEYIEHIQYECGEDTTFQRLIKQHYGPGNIGSDAYGLEGTILVFKGLPFSRYDYGKYCNGHWDGPKK